MNWIKFDQVKVFKKEDNKLLKAIPVQSNLLSPSRRQTTWYHLALGDPEKWLELYVLWLLPGTLASMFLSAGLTEVPGMRGVSSYFLLSGGFSLNCCCVDRNTGVRLYITSKWSKLNKWQKRKEKSCLLLPEQSFVKRKKKIHITNVVLKYNRPILKKKRYDH